MQVMTKTEINLMRRGGAIFKDFKFKTVLKDGNESIVFEFTIEALGKETLSTLISQRNIIHSWVDIRTAFPFLYDIFPELINIDEISYSLPHHKKPVKKKLQSPNSRSPIK